MNAKTFSLTATERPNQKKSARDTRQQGLVPGVVYGYNFKPLSIALPYSDILRTYRQAGESALVDLTIGKKNVKTLIHRMTLHPVTRAIYHVDFYVVNLKEKTDIPVPFEFVGDSPAVKNFGGVLIKECETILLRCLPSEIPSSIEVPLDKLENIGDHITIESLGIDFEKYELMDLSPETVIASVLAPKLATEAEEDESAETEDTEGEETEADAEAEKSDESPDKKDESARVE